MVGELSDGGLVVGVGDSSAAWLTVEVVSAIGLLDVVTYKVVVVSPKRSLKDPFSSGVGGVISGKVCGSILAPSPNTEVLLAGFWARVNVVTSRNSDKATPRTRLKLKIASTCWRAAG